MAYPSGIVLLSVQMDANVTSHGWPRTPTTLWCSSSLLDPGALPGSGIPKDASMELLRVGRCGRRLIVLSCVKPVISLSPRTWIFYPGVRYIQHREML